MKKSLLKERLFVLCFCMTLRKGGELMENFVEQMEIIEYIFGIDMELAIEQLAMLFRTEMEKFVLGIVWNLIPLLYCFVLFTLAILVDVIVGLYRLTHKNLSTGEAMILKRLSGVTKFIYFCGCLMPVLLILSMFGSAWSIFL